MAGFSGIERLRGRERRRRSFEAAFVCEDGGGGLGEVRALAAADVAWLELPVIDNPGAIGRWFIDNGMRRGIPDRQVRARVFTVYTDRVGFLTAIGIDDAREVVALVVDRGGQILARQSGGFAVAKADALFAVLRTKP